MKSLDLFAPAQVALVDPCAVIAGRKVNFLRDNFGGEVPLSCAYPPLELAFTASLLESQGTTVTLIPANVLGIPHVELSKRLKETNPQFIFVPSAWGSLSDDLELMRQLRENVPNAQLLIGGPNIAAGPDRPLSSGLVDFALTAEPESTVAQLAAGVDRTNIHNLSWLEEGKLVQTERSLPTDWITQPPPARNLLPLEKYLVPFSQRLPSTTMQTARGCSSSCNFCPTHIWNGFRVRERPLDLVIVEILELVHRYGIKEVSIRDDTFTANRTRVLEFCERLTQQKIDLSWRCFATAATVDPELLKTMRRAGCFQICIGFESGADEILKRTGKKTTVQQGQDAARWAHDAGIEVSGTFLVGLQGESVETIEESIRTAIEMKLDYVQVNVATPLPGTGFARIQSRANRHSSPDQFRWSGMPTGETEFMSPDELAANARRFYRKFYFRPEYVFGRLTSARGLRSLISHARLGMRMVRHTVVN